MRLHLWNLEFARIARMVRTRQRLVFLVIGALLLIIGVTLRSTIAVISGMLIMGSFAFDAQPGTSTSAHVRMWQWLHKNQADRL
jgi:thiamine transporter ThiT